ncbi:MAG: PTS sugar transporter subunit IIA [Candidatus Omnitrophica bacterium]|nr:PTS sugar transporter subunit IIA [Candidatus Omnitrophota bacterium]
MINFSNYLKDTSIIPSLKAHTREEAIQILIEKLFTNEKNKKHSVSKKEAFESVLKREKLQSTGIGNALAFPHARIKDWGEFTMVAAVCNEGLDFTSIDGKPVKCIFLMISSTDEPYIILQTMSAVVRAIGEMGFSSELENGSIDFLSLLKKFTEKDITTSKNVLARDIARPIEDSVHLDTSLKKVTQMMHFKRVSILPVVDDENKLCGEISCYNIFDYGMPDFFKQLNTISFVKHIDPFEKYFKLQKHLKVKDILIKNMNPVQEDTTIAEIVFEMTVKKRSKLFMVNTSGQLTGVIDRFSIVDQILFF